MRARLPPSRLLALEADDVWTMPMRRGWDMFVCAVLWGCKTVPCVSPCVHVFFGDDKLLSAPMVSARIVPAPTNVPAVGDSVVSRQTGPA